MARFLVVCHLTASSSALLERLRSIAQESPGAQFTVLVPATPHSYWSGWDEAREFERASQVAERAQTELAGAGLRIPRAVAGSREPLLAIEDELRADPSYAGVVISTLAPGISRWLKMDLLNRARSRFQVPIWHVAADQRTNEDPFAPDESDDFAVEHERGGSLGPEGRARPTVVDMRNAGRRPGRLIGRGGHRRAPATAGRAADASTNGTLAPGTDAVAMPLEPTNLATALATNPAIAESFWALQSRLEEHSGFDPELLELVALRVSRQRHFEQQWQEHTNIARALGIPDARIAAIEHWHASEHVRFDERTRAILGYVDAVCAERGGVTEARATVREHLNESELVGLTLLIGFHRMAGSFAHGLGIETDGPFVGWNLYRGPAEPAHL